MTPRAGLEYLTEEPCVGTADLHAGNMSAYRLHQWLRFRVFVVAWLLQGFGDSRPAQQRGRRMRACSALTPPMRSGAKKRPTGLVSKNPQLPSNAKIDF